MQTKIKLVNSDASFLQDTSQLDVSKDASYMLDNFMLQNQKQPQSSNMFGAGSQMEPKNVPQTPALGGAGGGNINFFPVDDNEASFTGEQQQNDGNTNTSLLNMIQQNDDENANNQHLDNSLIGLGGNMMQGAMNANQDNMNRSLIGLENEGGMGMIQANIDTSYINDGGVQANASFVDGNDLNLSNIAGINANVQNTSK